MRNQDKTANKYPSCFPPNFEDDILPEGAVKESRPVYRIIKSGHINRDGFISTFEEIHRKLIPPRKQMKPDDPGLYSTSCFSDIIDAERILKLMMRHHPRPIIALGQTVGEFGPSQITRERVPSTLDSHVDWWIYAEAQPQDCFKEVKR